MLDGNVRGSLTRDDAQLALRLIARGSDDALRAAELLLRDGGIDALLDDERLAPAIVEARAGAARVAAALLLRRGAAGARRGGRARSRARGLRRRRAASSSRRAAAPSASPSTMTRRTTRSRRSSPKWTSADASRAFLVRQQLGNYALWLSGFFPDRIEMRRWRRGAPGIDYYDALGRRGFALAAEHRLANGTRAARRLRAGVRALREAARGAQPGERHAPLPRQSSPERLMRQVSDEARWRRAS